MITPSDRENLDALVNSAGWMWLSAYVTREWGPAGLRFQQAVREAAQSSDAVVGLQKVIAQQDAVHDVMQAPLAALSRLQAQQALEATRTDTAMSRRGPGL